MKQSVILNNKFPDNKRPDPLTRLIGKFNETT